ncbi:tetratricopeptide repeat protein [Cellvibrio japonicus]|uniref:TPR domain protein n=1 Tax=Cellvibrio japonicus (strain Ueda107) TaxID=498211 RepID=B3PJP0_CELJU|nr:tetratricopeptide repeat protein [Cellvibrio japonicus]ACE83707.1 TPR domain protein [Cellvibrio japonicus Ueda107]QEI11322.1 tetratricopeptide repeat protein [Cellvibrio japonicus]QEI14896.1 tetratricopeptide repeat protein [Cellvibrio japonicus]QEI18476.1 tetratricopeptide repeat protein [Cellvibrio japonicus]
MSKHRQAGTTTPPHRVRRYLQAIGLGLGMLLAYGCSPLKPIEDPGTQGIQPELPDEPGAPAAASGAAPLDLPERNDRAFDSETLYSLLAAEFAGNRRLYDLALSNYAQQARQTRDPQIAERATLLARYLGDKDTALEAAQIWMDAAPDNREALSNQALAQLEAGQLHQAFASSQRLLEQGETPHFQVIAAQANTLSKAEHDQLLAEFQSLLKTHKNNEQLLVGTGLLLEQQGDYPQAMTLARRALKLAPRSLPPAILEANLLHLLKRDQEAIAKMEDLLALHPDNHRLRYQYARILSHNDLAAAQQQFALLTQQLPHNGDIWLSLGIVALQREDQETAERAFEALVELGQHKNTANFYLGQMSEAAGNPDEALLYYLQVNGGSDFLAAQARLLDIFMQRGEYDAAHQHINRQSLRQPEHAAILFMLEAETLRLHQQHPMADQVLNEAIRELPDSIPLRYARALQYEQQGQLDKAEEDLRHLLSLQPDNAQALNALGYLLADRTNRLEEARNLVNQALALSPDEPAIIDSMGWIEYRSGNLGRAIELLQRAYDASGDAEIAAHLGEALWVSGRADEARQVWRQGLQKKTREGKTHPLLRSTLERLKVEL